MWIQYLKANNLHQLRSQQLHMVKDRLRPWSWRNILIYPVRALCTKCNSFPIFIFVSLVLSIPDFYFFKKKGLWVKEHTAMYLIENRQLISIVIFVMKTINYNFDIIQKSKYTLERYNASFQCIQSDVFQCTNLYHVKNARGMQRKLFISLFRRDYQHQRIAHCRICDYILENVVQSFCCLLEKFSFENEFKLNFNLYLQLSLWRNFFSRKFHSTRRVLGTLIFELEDWKRF